jgi:hypothetical protein
MNEEPSNIKINVLVTQGIFDYLRSLDNYSAYIRKLIEIDREHQQRKKNKRLV